MTSQNAVQLDIVRRFDFDWAVSLDEVWNDDVWDEPSLHQATRAEFVQRLEEMNQSKRSSTPMGWIILGSGGSGKTHLLGRFRQETQRRDAAFILVDMTDVRNFWATVLQGFILSLQKEYRDGLFQHQFLLHKMIGRMARSTPVAELLKNLSQQKTDNLAHFANKVLSALRVTRPAEVLEHQDVVRALICLNSSDFSIANLGMTWLQGLEIDEADRRVLGFQAAARDPIAIVKALSWLISLCGPTVLAFDQLDAIVSQHAASAASEGDDEVAEASRSIIRDVGAGLGSLRDHTYRTLVAVSCLESTWHALNEVSLSTFLDRFDQPPHRLDIIKTHAAAKGVVQSRLAPAFKAARFNPPYSTWPFRPESLEKTLLTPRELLKLCKRHRDTWLRQGQVVEVRSLDDGIEVQPVQNSDRLAELDQRFATLQGQTDVAYLLEEKQEDQRIAPILYSAMKSLARELDLDDSIGVRVDRPASGGKTTVPIHVRFRLIFTEENDREEHFCLRTLQHTNSVAFQNRLNSAMTESGIAKPLRFRRLSIIRKGSIPGGPKTQRLVDKFHQEGGLLLDPTDQEVRVLNAVHMMLDEGEPDLDAWLASRKPLSQLLLIQQAVPIKAHLGRPSTVSPHGEVIQQTPDADTPPEANGRSSAQPVGDTTAQSRRVESSVDGAVADRSVGSSREPSSQPVAAGPMDSERVEGVILLGRKSVAGQPGDPFQIPIPLLEKHTLVVAGAGSGKTVLVRRLIEEAALANIPSIVIDCANDLSTLGDSWPQPPDGWWEGDASKAEAYRQNTDVVVWTPGRESANPIALAPLPDLVAVRDNPEELDAMIAMAGEAIGPIVARGRSKADEHKRGILTQALRGFAREGREGLVEFIAFLEDLPEGARLGVNREEKLAAEIADSLKVARVQSPMLRSDGTPLDPAVLFGDVPGATQTRVSVVSLVGLPTDEGKQAFLNQLAMTLFSWIKQNPDPGPRGLRGLLVIDEAKDYVPSLRSTLCKESLARLAAQARKYHLGLVFATQNPKDIDNKIVANCSTHLYGKVNSPAAIEAVKELLQGKGGRGDDVSRLPRGRFYIHNADIGRGTPSKIEMPLCLSYHRPNPLDESEVLDKARVSREQLEAVRR